MKTALIFYGGWEGHHPAETTDLFSRLLEEDGFAVNCTESLEDLEDVADLLVYDLIIPNWTTGELSNEQDNDCRVADLGARRSRHETGVTVTFTVTIRTRAVTRNQPLSYRGTTELIPRVGIAVGFERDAHDWRTE